MTFEELLDKYDTIKPDVVMEIFLSGMDRAREVYLGEPEKVAEGDK